MLALLAKYKLALIGAALLGALGLGGAGAVAASGALPLTGLPILNVRHATTPAAARPGLRRWLAGHVAHGTVIVKVNGTWTTYTLDNGKISAISTTSITLRRPDGQAVTLSIPASAHWGKRDKAPKNLAKLQGRDVVVLSQHGAAAYIGAGWLVRDAAYADVTVMRKGVAREVQVERGVVRSVSATQISITRADGVTVTEPLAPKVRYHQAGVKGTVSASTVTTGAQVRLLVYNGKIIAVRIGVAPGKAPVGSSSASVRAQ